METLGAARNQPGVHWHGQNMEKQLFEGIGGRQSSSCAVLSSSACYELCTGSPAAPAGANGDNL